jgi:hypothetical protein
MVRTLALVPLRCDGHWEAGVRRKVGRTRDSFIRFRREIDVAGRT